MDQQQTFKTHYSFAADSRAGGLFLLSAAVLLGIFLLPTWSIWAPLTRAIFILVIVLLLLFGRRRLSVTKGKNHTITIDAQGVSSSRLEEQPVFLAWSDISTLTNKPDQAGIDLRSQTGHPAIQIEYRVTDFEKLLSILLEKVLLTHECPAFPILFKKPFFTGQMVAGITPFILIEIFFVIRVFLKSGDPWQLLIDLIWLGPVFLFALILVGCYVFFLESYMTPLLQSLQVNEDSFSITKKFRTTRIPFHEVQAVELSQQGGPQVKATLVDSQELFLGLEGCDPFAIYHVLHTAWEQDRERSSVPPQPPRRETQDFS